MGAAFFYHLTRNPLEVTLPQLLEKALGAGWRVAVRGKDEARLDWLDDKLWLSPEDGFLPHGRAGGTYDAKQPILLTSKAEATNKPQCIMTIDGAEIEPEEIKKSERVCILFDGNNPQELATARQQWKALSEAGCAAQYWSEESGRWSKQAEVNAQA